MTTPTRYQRVGNVGSTPTDYDTVGFPRYLRFDGTDDSLSTAAINLTATDKLSMFAGIRKLNDTTGGVVVETGTGSSSGAFYLYAGAASTAAGARWTFGSRGSGNGYIETAASFAAPLTNVLTCTADIGGATVGLRVNATATGTASGSQGTGNYGNLAMYIGRRTNTDLPWTGRLYSLIVRGAATSAADITATESWVANKTGVVL